MLDVASVRDFALYGEKLPQLKHNLALVSTDLELKFSDKQQGS